MPRSVKPSFVSPRPTHEDIARLAYDIFVARGSVHGSDVEHWFEAERLLMTTVDVAPAASTTTMAADAFSRPRARRGRGKEARVVPMPPRRRKAARTENTE